MSGQRRGPEDKERNDEPDELDDLEDFEDIEDLQDIEAFDEPEPPHVAQAPFPPPPPLVFEGPAQAAATTAQVRESHRTAPPPPEADPSLRDRQRRVAERRARARSSAPGQASSPRRRCRGHLERTGHNRAPRRTARIPNIRPLGDAGSHRGGRTRGGRVGRQHDLLGCGGIDLFFAMAALVAYAATGLGVFAQMVELARIRVEGSQQSETSDRLSDR